jgi:hypothetical protein
MSEMKFHESLSPSLQHAGSVDYFPVSSVGSQSTGRSIRSSAAITELTVEADAP